MKVRNRSLNIVLTNKLPWEDLLIGFQCRIMRKPNIYNANFGITLPINILMRLILDIESVCVLVIFQQVY